MNRYSTIVILLTSAVGSASTVAAATQATVPSTGFRMSGAELAIWNDPAFQKQFIQSYVAETEIEPRVTADEIKQMQKVLDLIAADDMDKAAAMLEKRRGEAGSAVFDFTLANIYFQREQLDQAAVLYRVAVEKHPKFRRAWKNLGLIYVRQSDWPNAIPALSRVVELGGGDAITYGLLGFAYSNVEDDLAAESAYRQAILLDPATLDWQMGLLRSFFKQARFADAVALCDRLIEKFPDRADLWLLQANAYIGLDQPLRAAENYQIVDGLGQSTVQSLSMLGDIYVNEELYELAVDTYIRAMELAPRPDPERAIRAAKVLSARGEYDQTGRLIGSIQAVYGDQVQPDDRKDLLKLQARIAVANGAGDEEARVLEEIVALDPLDGEALILLGQHSVRNGDAERAVFYYERAASMEKFEADAKVRHAQLLVGQGKYAEALPLLRRAQSLKPRDNIQQYMEQVERVAKSRS
ncbi:MAG: tetratricopeptide repeat protein [Phycisphaerales bacterium]|nr:tetratricopeptide repeat protein [Phycisphaerales bacterium]